MRKAFFIVAVSAVPLSAGMGCGSDDDEEPGGRGGTAGSAGSAGFVAQTEDECKASATDACSVCVCENCLDEANACSSKPACGAVLDCAERTGCTGIEDCSAACEEELNAATAGSALGEIIGLSSCLESSCASDCGAG
ncbi:MAG TPA: hypothetical protein VI072_24015 [Polyangiaceae bacterium]